MGLIAKLIRNLPVLLLFGIVSTVWASSILWLVASPPFGPWVAGLLVLATFIFGLWGLGKQ